MKPFPSSSATPSGDWLVVIDRLEASVFRSTVSGAAAQRIRAQLRDRGAGMQAALEPHQGGSRRARFFGFFEPLAGVLHGARRILIFGRATALGDGSGPFIFWVCNRHPELAGRIVGSIPIEPDEMRDAGLLAKARALFEHAVPTEPETSGVAGCVTFDRRKDA